MTSSASEATVSKDSSRPRRRLGQSSWILIGLLGGVFCGLFFGESCRVLEPFGTAGAASQDLAAAGLVERSAHRPEALATGPAGTVYLCHPFLVHAAQPHRGSTPRFLAQPELPPAEPFQLHRGDSNYAPVELAIRRGLQDG